MVASGTESVAIAGGVEAIGARVGAAGKSIEFCHGGGEVGAGAAGSDVDGTG